MYKTVLRPILFSSDSEEIHERIFSFLPIASFFPIKQILSGFCCVEDARLAVTIAGLSFPNPIGLAAGFDKNCSAFDFFEASGFGHVELGTITSVPQEGNPKPRIFRLIKDEALINRMGFPSKGVEALVANLSALKDKKRDAKLGVNIGKAKIVPIDDAESDYLRVFNAVKDFADYVTINVSSPNTPDLRKLQEPERLAALFSTITSANTRQIPLFIKFAPDLTEAELNEAVDVSLSSGISGIIATNTTLSREGLTEPTNEAGGLSGKPLHNRSLAFVQAVFKRTQGRIPILGVGGISSSRDVVAMMKAGASAVQIYTALVYEGPFLVRRILRELAEYADHNGLKSISELCGTGLNN